jgi:hypothetical protein
MPTTLARTCLAAAALLVAAAPATADAAKHHAKHKKDAVYELQLRGSEAVTWHYEVPPDGQCSYGAKGDGSQEVVYNTRKVKVKAVRSTLGERDGLIQLARLDDQVAQYGASQGIPAVVEVTREGDIKSAAGCGGTGGSTQQPPPKDCGLRWGRITLQAGWHNVAAFSVGGHYDNFAQPAPGETDDLIPPVVPPTSGDIIGAVYANCPILLPSGSAAALDDLTEVSTHINETRLPRKGKTLKISGGDRDQSMDPDGQRSSETSVAWNLKLKRVK